MRHLYTTHASWWPLLSPREDHAEVAAAVQALVGRGPLLDLGCGSGSLAHHLPERWEVVLVDRSPQMLALARDNNPGRACVQGDLTTVDLGRRFSSVLLHDTVMYLSGPGQLEAALASAARHLLPGGRLLVVPDVYEEDFSETLLTGTGADPLGQRAVVLTEWHWDPVPGDGTSQVEFTLQTRQGDTVSVHHEAHTLTLRSRSAYRTALEAAGFSLQTPSPLEAALVLGDPLVGVLSPGAEAGRS